MSAAFIGNCIYTETTDFMKVLIQNANEELKKSLQLYQDEDDLNRKIVEEFEISDRLLSQLSDILLDTLNFDSIVMGEYRKIEKVTQKLFVSCLESYLNSFRAALDSFEEYNMFLTRELKKYELAYVNESQNSNEDLVDLTNVQTSVLKLQDEIHQANEQQEHKKAIIDKLSSCFEIHDRINGHTKEKQNIVESLKNLRNLPPNLSDAESKLRELKQKFKEVSDKFTKEVTM